jgi:acyl-CoA reductase-like NAD-dependent aldehyde dehydrogenase
VHARAFLKYLKVNPGAQVTDADSDGNEQATPTINGTKPTAPKTPPPAKPSPPLPRAKVRLPGTEAGKRILVALKTTEGLDEASQAAIETALKGWPAAPENKRKKYLEEVIELMAKALDHLDEEEES